MKYARTCSVTGKGMNEGWVWGNGEFYTSTQEITISELRKWIEHDYFKEETRKTILSMSDDELLQFAYDNNICFWTEWED